MLFRTVLVRLIKNTHCHISFRAFDNPYSCQPLKIVLSIVCSLHTQLENRLGSYAYWSWWRADSSRGPLGYTYMMLCKHKHDKAIDCVWTEASFWTWHFPSHSALCSSESMFPSLCELKCVYVSVWAKWTRLQSHKYDVMLTVKADYMLDFWSLVCMAAACNYKIFCISF